MATVIGVFLVLHGLITLAIGGSALAGAAAKPEMRGLPLAGWYPVALGDSWLLRGDLVRIGGIVWLLAGIGMILTAASLLGVVVPVGTWNVLAIGSASLGLVALATFFHPYYVIAVLIDLAILGAATSFEPITRRILGV